MSRVRFGQLLGQIVRLSDHDIEEILQEQHVSHHRFGEIALSLGLCQPQDVWKAWCDQLDGEGERVDLSEIGIDTQAVAYMPRELAERYQAVPLRFSGMEMIVAVAEAGAQRCVNELTARLGLKVKAVLADEAQIKQAIDTAYPPVMQPAA